MRSTFEGVPRYARRGFHGRTVAVLAGLASAALLGIVGVSVLQQA